MIESRTKNMQLGLLAMIQYMAKICSLNDKVIVEIGSYKGDSASIFSEYFKTVYCVDAWQTETFNVPDTDVKEAEAEFDRRCKEHSNIVKVKGTSEYVAKRWELMDIRGVAVVYIDASHDYESVKQDIQMWKDTAHLFVCGHDYWRGKFDGVIRAVNEAFGKPDAVFQDTSWIVAKSVLKGYINGCH